MSASIPTENTDELLSRIRDLKRNNDQLREKVRRIIAEKRATENQKTMYEKEIKRLRMELNKLKSAPLVVGTVEDIMDDKVIVKSSTGPKFVVNAYSDLELTPGAQVALNQQTLAIMDILPTEKAPEVRGMEIIEKPDISYKDIGGLEQQIQEIKETVELPLMDPTIFESVGIDPPTGVLLQGPPGTGKTLLAKAVASSTDANFIRVVGSEFVQKYIGEGARLVRETFDMAKERAPSIIFIDELDAIAACRFEDGTSGDREVHRTMMQLLAEMDGFDPRGNVRLIGASNRPDILDPAILRPGRFDRIIETPLPVTEARLEILKIHTSKMNVSDDIDFSEIAKLTDGASGADLKAISVEAGMFAIRENRYEVDVPDFKKAIDKILKHETYEGHERMFI